MNREILNERYKEIFKNLNSEQQEAVTSMEGPVLVIAGPGTGKTQILSARIANILLETDALPENILCLTYTDAGRVAMRKRLQDMIGADAYRVEIHTFHSFCNQVIQENVSYFNKTALDPVSDLERIEFIKSIIDNLEEKNALKRYRGDVYYEIQRLANLYATMKKEAWSIEFLLDCIDEYIQKLPETDGFFAKRKTPTKNRVYEKGDIRDDKIAAETQKMEIVKEAIKTYKTYQEIMFKNSRYDFDDMINWIIKAFTENDSMLLDYKEKYQFILVDEYQDTSGSQNQLIQLLVVNEEKPNIFVVGDDDQSIYRFQGANIENIETYKNFYGNDLKRIVLKANYRSTQSILDTARSVIENNKERLSAKDKNLIKDLIASNSNRIALMHKPTLKLYENPFQEMVDITCQIFDLIYKKNISAENIAVIYSTNKQGAELMKFFKAKNIPYYSKNTENLFEISLSKKLLTILKYIAYEIDQPYSADNLLFEILHFDIYNIPPYEIAKASVRVNDLKYDNKTSLRTYLLDWVQTVNPNLFENKPHDGIVEIMKHLEKWIQESLNITIIQLLENIMHEGRFIQTALNSNDRLWQLEVLRAFMDFVKDEMHRNPKQSLVNLIETIELMQDQDLHLPLTRTFGNENGVNLLTAHGSKGLEFQYVFLIGAVSNKWENSKGFSTAYKLPDTVLNTKDKETEKAQKEEERRRLFFVALTRAEEHLSISWTQYDEAKKPMEPSKFIAEILEKNDLPIHKANLEPETINEFLEIYLLRNKKPIINESEHDFIDELLNRFEMNATALNNFLTCPLRFYYSSLIRIPGGRSEASEFGSAIHHALEILFAKRKENENVFPEKEVFLNDFQWYMYRFRESFTKEGLARRLEYGNRILSELYDTHIDHWNEIEKVSIERMFKSVVVDGVPLKGKIDKMELDGRNVIVVDYKTGNPEKNEERTKPPTAKKPNGGDYWRQAIFYKIMIDAYKMEDFNVLKTTFQYVEPTSTNEHIEKDIYATDDDIETVKSQIKDTWNKIQNHDFYKGCGEETCQYCNFVKDTKQYISLEDINGAEVENE